MAKCGYAARSEEFGMEIGNKIGTHPQYVPISSDIQYCVIDLDYVIGVRSNVFVKSWLSRFCGLL